MKILFDQGTPAPLRRLLAGHNVSTAYEMRWATLTNGDLIKSAENEGFEVFITTDQNLKYQQNMSGRKIAVVVLLSTSWPRLQTKEQEIRAAINDIRAGDYVEIPV